MRTRMHLWLSLLALLALACLWGRQWVGAASLTAGERAHIQGGDINLCVGTISTCTDPSLPMYCTYNTAMMECQQCKPTSNTPYTGCKSVMNPNLSCSVSVPPGAPWCGWAYWGPPSGPCNTCASAMKPLNA